MSTEYTNLGQFANAYRRLHQDGEPDKTPVVLAEGDSWFSTPLYRNAFDWVKLHSKQALFFEVADSGNLATDMFAGSKLKQLMKYIKKFNFDVVLLSAGGNDFVAEFLKQTFAVSGPMTVAEAVFLVNQTGRYQQVYRAYESFVRHSLEVDPELKFVAHTYAYPQLLGQPAKLTVEQIGLVALFKREIGDWIQRHIKHALPDLVDQQAFVLQLIDGFHDQVLVPIRNQFPGSFTFVDVRDLLPDPVLWNDEMHPTATGYALVAREMFYLVDSLLPEEKRGQWKWSERGA